MPPMHRGLLTNNLHIFVTRRWHAIGGGLLRRDLEAWRIFFAIRWWRSNSHLPTKIQHLQHNLHNRLWTDIAHVVDDVHRCHHLIAHIRWPARIDAADNTSVTPRVIQ